MNATRRRPAGFTLIELLVVVAILATLAALGAGGYFRIQNARRLQATEDTVSKLEGGLQNQWKAELDTADRAFKGTEGNYAQQVDLVKAVAGDQDRARSLWNYLWMKNAFPQAFNDGICPNVAQRTGMSPFSTADTRKGAWLWSPAVASTPAVLLVPQSPAFAGIPATDPNGPTITDKPREAAEQSAILLYRALVQKSSRGQTFNPESVGGLVKTLTTQSGLTDSVCLDTYGRPLAFVRFATAPELQQPPYTKPNVASQDPLDPLGRLGVTTWANKGSAEASLGLLFGTTGTPAPPVNWLPTIVARANRPDWALFPIGVGVSPLPDNPDGMIYGFKLRRQGNRGDQ